MYEELIKHLRGCANTNYCYSGCPEDVNDKCQEHLMLQAADVIEKLSKELIELKLLTCCCTEPPKEE